MSTTQMIREALTPQRKDAEIKFNGRNTGQSTEGRCESIRTAFEGNGQTRMHWTSMRFEYVLCETKGTFFLTLFFFPDVLKVHRRER